MAKKSLLFAIYFVRLVYTTCSRYGYLELCSKVVCSLCIEASGVCLKYNYKAGCHLCILKYTGEDSWNCIDNNEPVEFQNCTSSWAELEKYFGEAEFAYRQELKEANVEEAWQKMDEELMKIDVVTRQNISQMFADKLQSEELLKLLKEKNLSADLTKQKQMLLTLLKTLKVSSVLTIEKLIAILEAIVPYERQDEKLKKIDVVTRQNISQMFADELQSKEQLKLLKEKNLSADRTNKILIASQKQMLLALLKTLKVSSVLTIEKLIAILKAIVPYERQVRETKTEVAKYEERRKYYDELVKEREAWVPESK